MSQPAQDNPNPGALSQLNSPANFDLGLHGADSLRKLIMESFPNDAKRILSERYRTVL